jgi:UDP:flavonoid glycosyltransferase YjiC (YdhE family)
MRALVSTNPYFGHFDPLVPLARALAAGGHDVLVATEPAFCDTVRARGLHATAVGRDLTDEDMFAALPDILDVPPEEQDEYAAPRMFVELRAHNVVDDLDRLASDWRPDVIVRESAEFASWAVAERHGLTHVTVNVGQAIADASWIGSVAPWFRDLGERVGLAELDAAALDRYALVAFEPAGYHDWTDAPTASVFRPPIAPGTAYRGAFPGAVDRPLIYVTLGSEFTNPGLMADMLAALADGDWNVVVATGPKGDPAAIDPGRANVIVQHWVPQHAVLNDADLVVTHAGAGTTIGALVRGVPLVCVPQGADQFHHARRVAELGAGIDLAVDQRSPAEILDAVTTVLSDERYRSRAEELAFDTVGLPDVTAAAALVEDLAGS